MGPQHLQNPRRPVSKPPRELNQLEKTFLILSAQRDTEGQRCIFSSKSTYQLSHQVHRKGQWDLLKSCYHPQFFILVALLHPVSSTWWTYEWRERDHSPDPPATTKKKLRASETRLFLHPASAFTEIKISESLWGKKVPNPIFYVCVCRFVCLSVFLLFFLPPHHQVLAWCQMFQLSIAVQHHWWWT